MHSFAYVVWECFVSVTNNRQPIFPNIDIKMKELNGKGAKVEKILTINAQT